MYIGAFAIALAVLAFFVANSRASSVLGEGNRAFGFAFTNTSTPDAVWVIPAGTLSTSGYVRVYLDRVMPSVFSED
jgi:hypothetical protein